LHTRDRRLLARALAGAFPRLLGSGGLARRTLLARRPTLGGSLGRTTLAGCLAASSLARAGLSRALAGRSLASGFTSGLACTALAGRCLPSNGLARALLRLRLGTALCAGA